MEPKKKLLPCYICGKFVLLDDHEMISGFPEAEWSICSIECAETVWQMKTE